MSLGKRATAEFFGTFWLVFGGVRGGSTRCLPSGGLGIGFVGVALAFGLTVLTMAFAMGHTSGCQSESRSFAGPGRRQAIPDVGSAALLDGPGAGRNRRIKRAVRHRVRAKPEFLWPAGSPRTAMPMILGRIGWPRMYVAVVAALFGGHGAGRLSPLGMGWGWHPGGSHDLLVMSSQTTMLVGVVAHACACSR